MENPFASHYEGEERDLDLVAATRRGSREAMEELVHRHQAWIYNLVLRMVWNPEDARDATQEILVKVLTKLSTYEARSSFRTWLYRIVTNHVIDMRRSEPERAVVSFEAYGKGIDSTPDLDLVDPDQYPVDAALLVEETKIGCMMAMLLCLDRPHRLAFILGSVLGVSAEVGADLTETTEANFRQRLSRARRKVSAFMEARCSEFAPGRSCRCERKTQPLLTRGHVNPARLRFSALELRRVRDMAEVMSVEMDELMEDRCSRLFREHPFYEPPDLVTSLRGVLQSPEFQRLVSSSN